MSLTYKSYCWSFGTTSFRMFEFNKQIETQLQLIKNFWNDPNHSEQKWSQNNSIQEEYYNFLKSKGFITGNAYRKDKDAREKTSGLVDLGLISSERRINECGEALLDSLSYDGPYDNPLSLSADSYIYLKQLLKVSYDFDDNKVRPFVALALVLNELGNITDDEFTYLIPLITSRDKLNAILNGIKDIRSGSAATTIDSLIIQVLFSSENYIEAYNNFVNAPKATENLILDICMNRKSRSYDKPYYNFYLSLQQFAKNHSNENAKKLSVALNSLNDRVAKYWKKYLFINARVTKKAKINANTYNLGVRIFNCQDETSFRSEFIHLLHLYKAKVLLDDYSDLNKRYLKTSSCILFENNTIQFDILPRFYFKLAESKLQSICFTASNNLEENVDINIILDTDIKYEDILNEAKKVYGPNVTGRNEITELIENDRYDRLNKLIEDKFNDQKLIRLLDCFEQRRDDEILNLVSPNADIPTIFEYIVGIIWYKISGREGKILNYMRLSLDADLLPIAHAAGGHEDITYFYDGSDSYPPHTLLIEVTLSNDEQQRRMEFEPVSRHLGNYMLHHRDQNTYCLFVTTSLYSNTIQDFKQRAFYPYYSSDGTESVNGLTIIPCKTTELKTILKKNLTYNNLYNIFQNIDMNSNDINPLEWYQNEIADKINNL